jgi:hypothetical protein
MGLTEINRTGNNDYDIRDFGARGDGKTLNTAAIQAAIDRCSTDGGGKVAVSQGRYVTGTLFLKDDVTLHIANGAVLLGSTDIADYAAGTHKNMYRDEPHMDPCLIFARGVKSIGLEGQGVIDGQGQHANFSAQSTAPVRRTMLIRLMECTNIRVKDLTLQNPAAWTSAWLYCTDIVVEGVTIRSRANSNGDGLDFDGCREVRVSNCSFDTSDDSICLQTSRPDRPCRDVTISNCIFRSQWAGMRIGLLSMGDFENVAVTNCIFTDIEDAGLKIQLCEGGAMRNMTFSNLAMHNVPRPIFMTFSQQRACVDAPGLMPMKSLSQMVFTAISVDSSARGSESAIIMSGIPGHLIEDIVLSDITLKVGGGGTADEAQRRSLPEYMPEMLDAHPWAHWPEYVHLGGAVPAHGVYARHMKDLTLRNLTIIPARADARPAVVCEDVHGLEISGASLRGDPVAAALIRLQIVQQAYIHGCFVQGQANALVQVEGSSASDIHTAADNLCQQ